MRKKDREREYDERRRRGIVERTLKYFCKHCRDTNYLIECGCGCGGIISKRSRIWKLMDALSGNYFVTGPIRKYIPNYYFISGPIREYILDHYRPIPFHETLAGRMDFERRLRKALALDDTSR